MKKKLNKWMIIMFLLIISVEILVRIDNRICNIIGICLFPLVIISGFMLLKKDKIKESN